MLEGAILKFFRISANAVVKIDEEEDAGSSGYHCSVAQPAEIYKCNYPM